MAAGKHRKDVEPTIQEDLVEGVLFVLSTHDQKWRELMPEHAVIAREALRKAVELRKQPHDAGDTYLQGVTDALTIFSQSALATEVMLDVVNLPTAHE